MIERLSVGERDVEALAHLSRNCLGWRIADVAFKDDVVGRDADAVVDDVDDRVVAVEQAADGDAAFAELVGEPVFDRVLDERLISLHFSGGQRR